MHASWKNEYQPEYCDEELDQCFIDNGFYHKFIPDSAYTPIKSFDEAIAATPENCILAPILLPKDVQAARATILDTLLRDNTQFAYVGVYKTLANYNPGQKAN